MTVIIRSYEHALTKEMITSALNMYGLLRVKVQELMSVDGWKKTDTVKAWLEKYCGYECLIDFSLSNNEEKLFSLNKREDDGEILDVECFKPYRERKEGELSGVSLTLKRTDTGWQITNEITVYIYGDEGQFDTTVDDLESLRILKTITIL